MGERVSQQVDEWILTFVVVMHVCRAIVISVVWVGGRDFKTYMSSLTPSSPTNNDVFALAIFDVRERDGLTD